MAEKVFPVKGMAGSTFWVMLVTVQFCRLNGPPLRATMALLAMVKEMAPF
jgi:hypothetical protein